jgi:hypothetical protein
LVTVEDLLDFEREAWALAKAPKEIDPAAAFGASDSDSSELD